MTRHGGQLVEVISRITGFLDFRTSFSKLLSLTLTILMSSLKVCAPFAFAREKEPAAKMAAQANAKKLFGFIRNNIGKSYSFCLAFTLFLFSNGNIFYGARIVRFRIASAWSTKKWG